MATDTVEGADRGSGKKRPLLLILSLAGGSALAFLLLAWPTLYRYPEHSQAYRVNRLTGKAQVYDKRTEEWRPTRRGRNTRGTEGGPYDARGPRSGGPAPGGEWWHDGKGSGSESRGAGGNRWWYSDEEGGYEPPSGGSPIGGSRGGSGGGRGDRGGGSPIGGSRSGGQSPVGGGGSPIGGG